LQFFDFVSRIFNNLLKHFPSTKALLGKNFEMDRKVFTDIIKLNF